MARNRKSGDRGHPGAERKPEPAPEAEAPVDAPSGEPESGASAGETPPAPTTPVPPPRASRLRRLLPDLAKAVVSVAVLALAAAIWHQPPLIEASFPRLTYHHNGQTFADARIFRPLAMPTRYYIALPRPIAAHYEWFAVDRRREVAALMTAPPSHRSFGLSAIRRGDPLGLDLEFKKLDGSEWQVHFLDDEIVFSNAVLCVRLDARPALTAEK